MEKVCTCGKKFETENEEDVLCQECLEKKVDADKEAEAARKDGYLTKKEIQEGKVEVQRINYLLKRERSAQDILKDKIKILEKEKETREDAELGELDKAKKEAERLKEEKETLEDEKKQLEHKNLINSVLMKTKHTLKGLYLGKVDGEDEAEIVQNIKRLEQEQEEFIKACKGEGDDGGGGGPTDVNPKDKGKSKPGDENLGEKKAKEEAKKLKDKGLKGKSAEYPG